jgi:dihydrofolate reductase
MDPSMLHRPPADTAPPGAHVRPNLALIAALGRNRVIGRDNAMPWHLPEDLKHFKATTMGAPVIMGRKTYESIGRPLPGRRNVVITRDPAKLAGAAVDVVTSLDAALALAADAPRVFVIGGGEIYAQALPIASRLVLTEIDAAPEGDARFPDFDRDAWVEVSRDARHRDEPPLDYAFVTYERRAI